MEHSGRTDVPCAPKYTVWYICLAVLSCVVAATTTPNLPGIIGAMLAIWVFGYIVAGLPWLFCRCIGRKMGTRTFLILLTCGMVLISLANIVVKLYGEA